MHFVHCVAFQAQTIALFFWLPVVQTPDVNQALPSVKVFVWSIPILFVSILIHRSEQLQLQLQQLLSAVLCVIFSSAPFFQDQWEVWPGIGETTRPTLIEITLVW